MENHETATNRVMELGQRIENGTASPAEALEWLKLNSNGNPARDKAIAILEKEMAWSPTPPTVPGLYRYAHNARVYIEDERLYVCTGKLHCWDYHMQDFVMRNQGGMWLYQGK